MPFALEPRFSGVPFGQLGGGVGRRFVFLAGEVIPLSI